MLGRVTSGGRGGVRGLAPGGVDRGRARAGPEADLAEDLLAVLVEARRGGAGVSGARGRHARRPGQRHGADARLVEPGDGAGRGDVRVLEELEVAVDALVHDAGGAEPLAPRAGAVARELGDEPGGQRLRVLGPPLPRVKARVVLRVGHLDEVAERAEVRVVEDGDL